MKALADKLRGLGWSYGRQLRRVGARFIWQADARKDGELIIVKAPSLKGH